MAENLANDVQTTLNGAITNVATAITVAGSTGFPAANFRIRVDNEIMLVTSVGAGTNWTVTRAQEGTTGVAHNDGTYAVHVLTAASLLQYIIERAATQAQQETSTATDVFVTPATQQFHPSAAKGWVYADAAAGIGASYNVSSVGDNAVGDWTVNWNVDFSSAAHCDVTGARSDLGVVTTLRVPSFAAGTSRLVGYTTTTFTAADPTTWTCVVFGDQ